MSEHKNYICGKCGCHWMQDESFPAVNCPKCFVATAPREGTIAGDILHEAAKIVEGARNQTHGDKERSFGMIAALWSVYLEKDITAVDVCHMMVLLKIARASCGNPVRDHWTDMAGYSAIAGELAL